MIDPVQHSSLQDNNYSLEEVADFIEQLRTRFLVHLNEIQLGDVIATSHSKAAIRASHAMQRNDILGRERNFIDKYGPRLIRENFANGSEVIPEKIRPYLVPVESDTPDARLFRLATMLWSVPVSKGFGRRMRYLVRDRSNGKLIGLFGLTDPVFNLTARDRVIGWDAEDRRQRLVNVMDAHVVGAVPPYSQLIGGKLVASLMTSDEVCKQFAQKYRGQSGIISGDLKKPKLALITVTSALGRSSLYNRLRLPDLVEFRRIGSTKGWGHFHVPDQLFLDMRRLLQMTGHRYADGHQFGQGPNWRLRVVRVALNLLELDQKVLRHGIEREVYMAPLAENWQAFLTGVETRVHIHRPSVAEIGRRAVDRWIVPRATRCVEYQSWSRGDTWTLLNKGSTALVQSYIEQSQLI